MAKFLFFAVLLLVCSNAVKAQSSITGRVVTADGGIPVAGSSVFLSNTSKGTVADKNGYFEITNIPFGKHELVVSNVGYETNVFSFSSDQLPLKVRVELTLKVQELGNVIVEPSVEEGWDKWGKMFTENFIGQTPNALRCKIKNEKAIRFRYYRKSNRVVAWADEPVILENRALGYRVRYQLEEFEVNFSKNTTVFYGYPLFEELDKDKKTTRQRWVRARQKAYYGSMMHFMYSLFHDSLSQQGFEVRRMQRSRNTEKDRIRELYRNGKVFTVEGLNGAIRVPASDTARITPPDSLTYFERVMRQKDFLETYSRVPLTRDSLALQREGNYLSVYFPDYLYVTYKNETEDQAYLDYHHEKRNATFQRSYITLTSNAAIVIDVNGNYYPPQQVFSSGYWGWCEKMSDCLPSDFEVEKTSGEDR